MVKGRKSICRWAWSSFLAPFLELEMEWGVRVGDFLSPPGWRSPGVRRNSRNWSQAAAKGSVQGSPQTVDLISSPPIEKMAILSLTCD